VYGATSGDLYGLVLLSFHAGVCMKSEIVNLLAEKMADSKEAVIREALNRAIGSENWTLNDIDGKVMFNYFPDGIHALVYDGIELILFYPKVVKTIKVDEQYMLNVQEPYKVLV
jgi:hypothetical protein